MHENYTNENGGELGAWEKKRKVGVNSSFRFNFTTDKCDTMLAALKDARGDDFGDEPKRKKIQIYIVQTIPFCIESCQVSLIISASAHSKTCY